MAIKAPPEAKLHVPHPSDGLQIYMSSESGEIEVFLCPEEETNPESGADSESDLVSRSFIFSQLIVKELVLMVLKIQDDKNRRIFILGTVSNQDQNHAE